MHERPPSCRSEKYSVTYRSTWDETLGNPRRSNPGSVHRDVLAGNGVCGGQHGHDNRLSEEPHHTTHTKLHPQVLKIKKGMYTHRRIQYWVVTRGGETRHGGNGI